MSTVAEHTINERFEKALTAVGIKPAELARRLGTEPVKLYRIIGGKTKPSIQTLEDVVALFPQISTDYIIKGIGPVLSQPQAEIIGYGLPDVQTTVPPLPEEAGLFAGVPYISITAYSTFIEQYTEGCGSPLEATYRLLYRTENQVKDCIVIEVQGSSMSPQINDRAKVLSRCISPDNWEYQSGGVYAVLFRDQLVIKRILENDLLTKGVLTLHPDNRLGGVVTVKDKDIRGMWKVVEVLENPVE